MATTLVPAAIDYLVALFRANVPPRVKVFDGPPLMGDVPSDFVAVAYSDDEETPAVDTNRQLSSFGNGIYQEDFTIRCRIDSFTGDNKLQPRRARVQEIFTTLGGLIDADRTLGGIIRPPGLAEIGDQSWNQDPYEDGSVVSLVFYVRVDSAVLWPGA
jgi:hypothetical protein